MFRRVLVGLVAVIFMLGFNVIFAIVSFAVPTLYLGMMASEISPNDPAQYLNDRPEMCKNTFIVMGTTCYISLNMIFGGVCDHFFGKFINRMMGSNI